MYEIKDLITELQKFNPELEVTISDGFDCRFYTMQNISISEYIDFSMIEPVLDIGIGSNLIEDDDE